MISASERQNTLFNWIAERPEHQDMAASEIVDVSGIYTGHGRYDTCLADLKRLQAQSLVTRSTGRPARWGIL